MANWHIGEHFHYETARPPNVSHKLYGTACQKGLEEADNTTQGPKQYDDKGQRIYRLMPDITMCFYT